MKRLLIGGIAAALAFGTLGVAHAQLPPAPVGLSLPGAPIVLSLPPGYQSANANIGCQFAADSGGGVLAMPSGFGGGTVHCR